MINHQHKEKRAKPSARAKDAQKNSGSAIWNSSGVTRKATPPDSYFEEPSSQQIVPEYHNLSDELGSSEASEKLLNYHDDEILSFVGLGTPPRKGANAGKEHYSYVDDRNALATSYRNDFEDSDSEDRCQPRSHVSFKHPSPALGRSPSIRNRSKPKNSDRDDVPISKAVKMKKTTSGFEISQLDSVSDARYELADDGNSSVTHLNFKETARINPRNDRGSSDVIGTIDFNEIGSLFATGGIARKIRIYSMESILQMIEFSSYEEVCEGDALLPGSYELNPRKRNRDRFSFPAAGSSLSLDVDQTSLTTVCTPAKLSSLKWVPGHPNRVGCGDYDGVVSEWDLERGLVVCERDEHSGQRVWSLDYSRTLTCLSASASDDGTVRLWSSQNENSVGLFKAPSGRAICSAEFSPNSEFMVATACADTSVLLYDLRSLNRPVASLLGHARAASYVRFMGPQRLVSASVDNTIRVWDLSNLQKRNSLGDGGFGKPSVFGDSVSYNSFYSPTDGCHSRSSTLSELETPSESVTVQAPAQSRNGTSTHQSSTESSGTDCQTLTVLRGHQNSKNFVGLSVMWNEQGDGLIASGSESNEVVVYRYSPGRKSASLPVFRHGFPEQIGSNGPRTDSKFVSAVAWKKLPCQSTLVAANSSGIIKIIQGDEF